MPRLAPPLVRIFLAAPFLVLLAAAARAQADAVPIDEGAGDDRHSGYYYPAPETSETYVARAEVLEVAERSLRIGFVTAFTNRQVEHPAPPDFALFAKGADAEKLIIVGLSDERLNTLYRLRGLLAMLTAMSRNLPIFQEFGVQDWFTFFDLAKMLGFTQITVSDGRRLSHQIFLE